MASPIEARAADCPVQQEPRQSPHPRVRVHERFASRALGNERTISVYVPPGYEEDNRRAYPLLVLHDGQNLFDPATSFIRGRTWQVAEHADAAIEAGEVEPLIIAGVANAGDRRLAEYTPTRDWKLGGGDAARYEEMILRELLPFLHAEYRLRAGAAETGLGGSSLGGLVSLWMGMRRPDLFGRLAVLSPSIWWNHRYILRYVDDLAAEVQPRPRIWLDAGEREGRRTVANAEQLYERLLTHGWRNDADVHFETIADGTHDEASWAERVRPMLRFLFPARSRE
ncbi:MAG TPA: alpha/beta hydrolase-fold protein [Acidobacteriaceae bacterium]|nr:alpha/beta hydrolase-fold protein [Acidobacteriaceae bacterium]